MTSSTRPTASLRPTTRVRTLASPLATARVAAAGVALALFVVLLAVAAPFALADSPVTWEAGESTYGPAASPTPFIGLLNAGYAGAVAEGGQLQNIAGAKGFWDSATSTYYVGFATPSFTEGSLPPMTQTDLSKTPLTAGTRVSLVFSKDAGQPIDYIAVTADPDQPVTLDLRGAADLTAAERFTVSATVVKPAATLQDSTGSVAAAFGVLVHFLPSDAGFAPGDIFVTDAGWLDLAPPTLTTGGLAGLRVNGSDGHAVRVDGILSSAQLSGWGITATQVGGYVGGKPVAGSSATFSHLTAGAGTLWPVGYEKFSVSNSAWSPAARDVSFGPQGLVLTPGKATPVSPKGAVSGTRPTFRWRAATRAATYEVRVYRGAKQLLRKTGLSTRSWRASKALPRGVSLTWKVKAANGVGSGAWSAVLKFKIR
jgi:hypothetical protein